MINTSTLLYINLYNILNFSWFELAEGQILVHSGPLESRSGPIHQTPSTLNLDFDTKPLILHSCVIVSRPDPLLQLLHSNRVIKPLTWGLYRDYSDS